MVPVRLLIEKREIPEPTILYHVYWLEAELWIRIRDPGWKKNQDPDPDKDEHSGSYFRELRNNYIPDPQHWLETSTCRH
jgi:hypothetical protein